MIFFFNLVHGGPDLIRKK